MKILFGTLGFQSPAHGAEALLGEDNVRYMDLAWYLRCFKDARKRIAQKFVQAAEEFDPDWIFLQTHNLELVEAPALRKLREILPNAVITNWVADVRGVYGAGFRDVFELTDATLVCHEDHRDRIRAAGASEIHYCQNALSDKTELEFGDESFPFEVPPVLFCGNLYSEQFIPGRTERIQTIQAFRAAGIPVGVLGNDWPPGMPVLGTCKPDVQKFAYKKARVALSINHFPGLQRYWSRRQLLAMASGTPVVTPYSPGMEKEFVRDDQLLWYKTIPEGIEIIKRLLARPAIAAAIGRAGRKEVLRAHKWSDRIRTLQPLVEQLRK